MRAVRSLLPLAAALPLALPLLSAAPAAAHGGITIAEGGRGGTRIVVQGAEAHTERGAGVDLSTVLDGPGSGEGSKVVYWVRPKTGKSFRVRTDRDAGGVHHAELLTAGRGAWQDWDVSAFVTLATGKTLRVTNDKSDPPGPPPAEKREAPATTTGATTTDSTASAPPAPSTEADSGTVEDVSGDGDGPPGWAIPSIVVVVLAALGVVLLRRRSAGDGHGGED
ncbi:hypothetical protein [Patulibacter defluvii]|uniref:hypothetical protein n=1 Tax=Patulibacter defluvii TaxID=3095358 RepID=UPI002A766150|nr:hypothetical protein [Patulibacter sp. DM4]